jgi:hypothetical protein
MAYLDVDGFTDDKIVFKFTHDEKRQNTNHIHSLVDFAKVLDDFERTLRTKEILILKNVNLLPDGSITVGINLYYVVKSYNSVHKSHPHELMSEFLDHFSGFQLYKEEN